MNKNPLVSVVIPTLNSEKTLNKCLESVKNQNYSNIEIILVDAGSEDNSIEIAKKFGVNVIETNVRSMSRQTNIGVSNSEGIYIYRVDSDVVLPPGIVKECVNKCEIENYDGVCIFWLPDASISFWAKVRRVEKECYIQKPNYVGSIKYDKNVLGARFLKRKVLEDVKGFDEDIPTAGEDYSLYNKLAQTNYQFATINCRENHIGEPKTIRDVIRKNFRYGKDLMFFANDQNQGISQFSPFARSYLMNAFKRALNKNIVFFFGLLTYLLVVYSSTTVGMAYSRFNRQNNRQNKVSMEDA